MRTSTSNLNQEPFREMLAQQAKTNAFVFTNKLIFVGIVILALGSWIAIVNYMSKSLITPSLASSGIIFLAAISHLIGNQKTTKQND
ncbi:MAG TPA: hypothetical protein VIN11_07320 [Roseivirga sp.]